MQEPLNGDHRSTTQQEQGDESMMVNDLKTPFSGQHLPHIRRLTERLVDERGRPITDVGRTPLGGSGASSSTSSSGSGSEGGSRPQLTHDVPPAVSAAKSQSRL
jgi:hypothetical protein